jgi:hypothetical protein
MLTRLQKQDSDLKQKIKHLFDKENITWKFLRYKKVVGNSPRKVYFVCYLKQSQQFVFSCLLNFWWN